MEILNVRWIFKNYFIRGVLRRWYVVLAALAGLWGTLEIWSRDDQKVVIGIVISAIVGFLLLFPLLFLINAFSALVKGFKSKSLDPVCPRCLAPLPIQFSCQCSEENVVALNELEVWTPAIRLPFLTYLTRGLFLNHCWECTGEFFPRSGGESTLRGVCFSCGSFIKEWDLHMLHTGKIIVSIEQSLDKTPFSDFLKTWDIGSHHKKLKGGEHYVRKQGGQVQHWFRWGPSLDPNSIPQNLTENVHYIWIDKESGTSTWQKTNTLMNHVRKEFKKITFGFSGGAEELRAGSLGIKDSKIIPDITLENFIWQQASPL